jgi:predicted  nucleic acid-binding Zn-ribbon protein
LNKHLEELIELSRLDKSIDEFTPLIETAQKKLARRTAKRDDIAEKINKLNSIIADANSKIVSSENQIKSLNAQLILGTAKEKSVKTEKEMKALQMESELAKEKLNFANEEIERHNRTLEVKEQELKEINRELEKANIELEKVSNEVSLKMASIESQKAKLFGKRESKIRDIDQKILSFYEKIRIWARNSAVVAVRKQACYGCYMKLNDSAYAEVIKSEDICTCHHCGRILYIEPQNDEVEA